MTGPLFKTTIVIWSEFNPRDKEIDALARDAMMGDAFCSRSEVVYRVHPKHDQDWVETEFFDSPEETI